MLDPIVEAIFALCWSGEAIWTEMQQIRIKMMTSPIMQETTVVTKRSVAALLMASLLLSMDAVISDSGVEIMITKLLDVVVVAKPIVTLVYSTKHPASSIEAALVPVRALISFHAVDESLLVVETVGQMLIVL